ncbi:MAG: DNA-directed RNA polymerase subunit alpha [Patescibacteria group bacterium]
MELLFTLRKDEEKPDYGRFVIEPLEQGYGHTLGAALRRVLLTGLTGAALTSAKIDKVRHPFSTIAGMKEDVIAFLLNLKKVRVKYTGTTPAKLTVDKKGPGVVKAGDLKGSPAVTVVNPEFPLATLASGVRFSAEFQVEQGTGFSPADDRRSNTVGVIPIDSVFSPVTRVNYKIEETRVGRVANYDRLVIELWTDGTVPPLESIKRAAEILVAHFTQIITPRIKEQESREKPRISTGISTLSVEELNLPARIANALVKGGYETVGQLLGAKPDELSRVRNVGEKSLKIIAAALGEHGIQFPAMV